MAVKERLLNGLMAERRKATALGLTSGLFVQIGAISFFRKLFVLEMRPQAGWSRKEEADSDLRGVCSGCTMTALQREAGWEGNELGQKAPPASCSAENLVLCRSFGARGGHGVGLLHVQLQSQLPS